MLISSSPSKILIGIPLDANVSVELLSWAIRVLANRGDSIIAMHIIGNILLSVFINSLLFITTLISGNVFSRGDG